MLTCPARVGLLRAAWRARSFSPTHSPMTSAPSPVEVACSDPETRAALQAWLDATRLVPPGHVRLEVSIEIPEPSPPVPPTFHQPEVAIWSDAQGVRIVWEHAPAMAYLRSGEAVARVTLSPEALRHLDRCTRTFLVTVLIFLLRRAGWHHVHAATAIDPLGRGWLFAGNAQAGKSTTAAWCATRGWAVSTDDTAFLRGDGSGVEVVGMHGPIALREGGMALLRRVDGTPLPARRKTGYAPEELGGRWVDRVRPDRIIFPSVGQDTTTVEPIAPRDILAALVRWSAWVLLEPSLAQEHLELIARLARQAQSYRVTLGTDLFTHPDRLTELLP